MEAFAKLAESPQQKTVIVPADMAGLVSSIAGVAELVKTANADAPRPPRGGGGDRGPSRPAVPATEA